MPPAIDLGPYRLTRVLRRTGRVVVLEGAHVQRGLPAAVKVLGPEATVLDRVALRNEARALARLHHPYVVDAYDAGEVDARAAAEAGGRFREGAPWIALELASDGTLAPREGAVPWSELGPLLVGLLDALGHAHARGVLHRDVKPSNVLLCAPGELRPGPKLADFGLATLGRFSAPPARDAGTEGFRAPEQAAGDWRAFGPWTDLYALGRTARFLADPRDVPAGFHAWVGRLTDPARSGRFQSAPEALRALRALAPVAAPSPPARTDVALRGASLALLRDPELVGRSDELAALRRAVDATRSEGHAGLVLVEGPTGVGATRLAQEVTRQLEEQGRAVSLAVSCHEGALPGRALADAAATALCCHGASVADVTRALDHLRAARGVALDLDATVALLAPALAPGVAPRLVRPEERVGAFVALVRGLAAAGPVVLCIDDLQWEPDALSVSRRLLAIDAPVCVLATVRTDVLTACAPLIRNALRALADDARARLELRPLDPHALSELVRARCDLPAGEPRRLADASEGRPGVAVQLLAARLDPREAASEGAHDPAPIDAIFPSWSSRVGALRQRLGDVTAVELAAFLGDAGPRWSRACALAGVTDPSRAVEPWVDAGLVLSTDPEQPWVFAHPAVPMLLRRAADAPRLHRLCAEVLAAEAHDPTAREALVHHLVHGDRAARALPLLPAAVEARVAAGDDTRAEELLALYAAAIDRAGLPASAPERGEHLRLRCYVLRNLLQHDELAELAATLEREARRHGWTHLLPHALRLRALAAFARGEPIDEVVARTHAGLEVATEPGIQARLWGDLGRWEEVLGRHVASRTAWARAVTIYRELGDDIGVAIALLTPNPADPVHHHAASEEALAIFTRHNDRIGMARALVNRGLAQELFGDLDAAATDYRAAVVHYEAVASPRVAHPRLNLGVLALHQGAPARARPLLQQALAAFIASNQPDYVARCHGGLAAVAVVEGDAAAYDAHVGEARRLADPASTGLADNLEVGGEHGRRRGHVGLVRRAWALAGVLYERDGDADAVARIAERMAALD